MRWYDKYHKSRLDNSHKSTDSQRSKDKEGNFSIGVFSEDSQ